jgi:hypothetical protein
MPEETPLIEHPAERTTYRCVVGHEIPGPELDELTEVRSLDQGAVVRLCREHGAPIAIIVAPPYGSERASGVAAVE